MGLSTYLGTWGTQKAIVGVGAKALVDAANPAGAIVNAGRDLVGTTSRQAEVVQQQNELLAAQQQNAQLRDPNTVQVNARQLELRIQELKNQLKEAQQQQTIISDPNRVLSATTRQRAEVLGNQNQIEVLMDSSARGSEIERNRTSEAESRRTRQQITNPLTVQSEIAKQLLIYENLRNDLAATTDPSKRQAIVVRARNELLKASTESKAIQKEGRRLDNPLVGEKEDIQMTVDIANLENQLEDAIDPVLRGTKRARNRTELVIAQREERKEKDWRTAATEENRMNTQFAQSEKQYDDVVDDYGEKLEKTLKNTQTKNKLADEFASGKLRVQVNNLNTQAAYNQSKEYLDVIEKNPGVLTMSAVKKGGLDHIAVEQVIGRAEVESQGARESNALISNTNSKQFMRDI